MAAALNKVSFFAQKVGRSINMHRILASVTAESLLVLDIDDTIGVVKQVLGRDRWFKNKIISFQASGLTGEEALLETLKIYNPVQHASKMEAIDKTVDWPIKLQQLRKKNVKIIGLTARNDELVKTTLRQLSEVGVSFCEDVIMPGSCIIDGKLVKVESGVIFASGLPKGQVLTSTKLKFVQELAEFRRVHFVDDSRAHADSIFLALKEKEINVSSWHYTYAKEIAEFDDEAMQIATIQEKHFAETKTLLTDREAQYRLRDMHSDGTVRCA